MASWWAALVFFGHLQFGTPAGFRRTRLRVKNKNLSMLVFPPRDRHRGSMGFINGISLMGVEDPRQIRVCHALAQAGFKVYPPEIPEIKNLIVNDSLIRKTMGVLTVLLQKEKRLSLFAPSFSAAL